MQRLYVQTIIEGWIFGLNSFPSKDFYPLCKLFVQNSNQYLWLFPSRSWFAELAEDRSVLCTGSLPVLQVKQENRLHMQKLQSEQKQKRTWTKLLSRKFSPETQTNEKKKRQSLVHLKLAAACSIIPQQMSSPVAQVWEQRQQDWSLQPDWVNFFFMELDWSESGCHSIEQSQCGTKRRLQKKALSLSQNIDQQTCLAQTVSGVLRHSTRVRSAKIVGALQITLGHPKFVEYETQFILNPFFTLLRWKKMYLCLFVSNKNFESCITKLSR